MAKGRNIVNNLTRRSPAGITSLTPPTPILQLPEDENADSLLNDYTNRRQKLVDNRNQSFNTRGRGNRGRGRF